jgi:hypothetical protein
MEASQVLAVLTVMIFVNYVALPAIVSTISAAGTARSPPAAMALFNVGVRAQAAHVDVAATTETDDGEELYIASTVNMQHDHRAEILATRPMQVLRAAHRAKKLLQTLMDNNININMQVAMEMEELPLNLQHQLLDDADHIYKNNDMQTTTLPFQDTNHPSYTSSSSSNADLMATDPYCHHW